MATGLPTSIIVAIEFTAGAWTDVSTSVRGNSIEIRVGRGSAAEDSQPGTMTLELDNIDGTFTPDNPLSAYYPNLVEGKRIRVQVLKSATTYTRFVGRIAALEPDFPSQPSQSVTKVTAIDSLGDLQRMTLRPWGYNAAPSASTVVFYPLNDTAARAGASELYGAAPDLTVRNVSATGGVDFASDSSLDVDEVPYAKLTAGKGLWHASPAFSRNGSQNWSAGGYVLPTDGSYGELFAVSTGKRQGSANYTSVSISASGITATLVSAGTTVATAGPIAVTKSEWLEVRVGTYDILAGAPYTLRLDVKGALTGNRSATDAASTTVGGGDCLSIGGSVDLSCARFSFTQAAGGGSSLSGSTFSQVIGLRTLTSALAGLATESGASALAATFAWIATPVSDVATPLKSDGRSAFDVLLDLARSESGIAYQAYSTSATQTVNLLDLASFRPTAVALTVDAEADGMGGPKLTRDVQDVAANATASSTLGSITVSDATLAAKYGTTPVSKDTVQGNANALYGIASDMLARAGSQNRLRLSSLDIDLATAQNDLYAAFFALTPGERLRYSGLPSTYFGVTYMDGFVEGWTERPSVDGYGVTFDLSPADAPREGIYDTARFSWGDGVCTASSLTSSATSVTLTWTGTQTLSTSAGDYPLDLNINGERVTVSSAPAGGTSPRTVTIVRGVAPTVARAHSAGDAVDVWDDDRFAF